MTIWLFNAIVSEFQKTICTKFAPKSDSRQKENLENALFSRFFDNSRKALIISWSFRDTYNIG